MSFKEAFVFFALSSLSAFSLFSENALSLQTKAKKLNYKKEEITKGFFTITTFHRLEKSDSIRIYIEGDGRAWKNKICISSDPTPLNPLALSLALSDDSDSVAYIARPGQFSLKKCDPLYWSKRRFSEEVVQTIDGLIDILKQRCDAKNVELVGYSGGAAIAVIIAASRKDVTSLRTVAGNLNLNLFCSYHKVSPMNGSLDPIDFAKKISNIPQRHFAGSLDGTVPAFMIRSFAEKADVKNCLTIIDGATHQSRWVEKWNLLLHYPLGKREK